MELIDSLEIWKRDRDQLIHALAKIPYNSDEIKEIAERGQNLTKTPDTKVRSVNRYYDKQAE